MITLYLDMDGVIADFHKAYYADRVRDGTWDKVRFREMVMQNKIFEYLDPMPNANVLLKFVQSLRDVNVEILSSKGTFDVEQGAEAERQKRAWLVKQNIPYKANFVRCKSEKAQYATPTSILIDDSSGCIIPFNEAGGHGFLHEDSYVNSTIDAVNNLIMRLKAEL